MTVNEVCVSVCVWVYAAVCIQACVDKLSLTPAAALGKKLWG